MPETTQEKLIDGYSVTVRGQYHKASGKTRTLGTFGPVTFFLPPTVEIPNGKKKQTKMVDGYPVPYYEQQFKKVSVLSEDIALYVIQRRLLPTFLAEKYPDCVRFRTCSIVPGGIKKARRPESEAAGLNKPVEEMSMQELEAFCKLKNITVALVGFTEIKDAREAVQYELDLLAEAKRQAAEGVQPGINPAELEEEDEDLFA